MSGTINIAFRREQEQRVANDYAALEHQIEYEKGKLVSFSNDSALIAINSPQLPKLTVSRIPHLESAFTSVFGHKVKVQIVTRAKQ